MLGQGCHQLEQNLHCRLAAKEKCLINGLMSAVLCFSPYILLQMLIEITEASSVITWDFDVSKGDVIFNIYHSKRAPQLPKKDSLGAHGITSLGAVNAQLIDRSWVLGQDYSMVEKAFTCREGESVQVREKMLEIFIFFYQFEINFVCPSLLCRKKLSSPSPQSQIDPAAFLCSNRAPT